MNFKANKWTDRQNNVIALRFFEPGLATFNSGELFETKMVEAQSAEHPAHERQPAQWSCQAAGGPIFRDAVSADCPKHLNPAIAFEMYQATLRRDEDLADRTAADIHAPSKPARSS